MARVVEVRCGQQTKNFVKFPYTEVESQSFSLIFEKQQGTVHCSAYVHSCHFQLASALYSNDYIKIKISFSMRAII